MNSLDASRSAALRFLQTVVVVDDHAYIPEEEIVEVATLGDESIDGLDMPIDTAGTPDGIQDPQDFHTEVVVEAFADLGINCAVLAPEPSERDADMRRVERLARRSDVIILDWVLNPRDRTGQISQTGDQTSLAFIQEILREDDAEGGRTRLICIYTGSADAAGILDKIEGALKTQMGGENGTDSGHDSNSEAGSDSQPEAEVQPATRQEHRIDFGSTRIVVLGKERPFAVKSIECVASKDLPSRVVDEFAVFVVKGLLREVALDSLSAVRDESHRLLRRFDGDLDPALISHRSTTSPTDAEQFARNLVGSELGTIVFTADVVNALSDNRVNAFIDDALADRTVSYYWKNPEAYYFKGSECKDTQELSVDVAHKALKLGIDHDEWIRDAQKKLAPKISRTPLLLPGTKEAIRPTARRIDSRFSMLSSLARDPAFEGERSHPPLLQLGAILYRAPVPPRTPTEAVEAKAASFDGVPRKVEPPQYWICLQPLCDAVRLTGSTKFPLLPLKIGKTNFNYVVEDEGDFVTLEHAGLKISEMELVSFVPDPESLTVRAAWSEGRWVFEPESDGPFAWKGSLRLDKAHKLLQSVVNVAGRIGIDEYEHLRGAARKD